MITSSYASESMACPMPVQHDPIPPQHYCNQAILLAIAGFVSLGLLMLILAGLCLKAIVSLVTLHWVGGLLILCFRPLHFLVRSVRASSAASEQPKGIIVRPQDAPELFDLIDRTCRRLRAPGISIVCINADCNASVSQSPRHGNRLNIGLTLMRTLTREQFEALIAHEISHLDRTRACTIRLIARLGLVLARLDTRIPGVPQLLGDRFRSLCRWYRIRLNGASLPLCRSGEHRADRVSVALTSARNAAQALTAATILKLYLTEKYWIQVFADAKHHPQPLAAPFSAFTAETLAVCAELKRWQRAALAQRTLATDSHPAFCERLAAIGAPAEFAPPGPGRAADGLLGSDAARVASVLDANWRRQIGRTWQQMHQNAQHQRQQLERMHSAQSPATPNAQTLLLHASLEESVGAGSGQALALRLAARERFPESLPVQFALGRQWLQMDHSEGAALIEAVVRKDPNALVPGAELLRRYYYTLGDAAPAERWNGWYGVGIAAQRERQCFHFTDEVEPHRLPAELVTSIVSQLRTIPDLRHVYLLRKRVRHFPQFPVFVLGFKSSKLFKRYDQARASCVGQAIRAHLSLPAKSLIVNIEGPQSAFAMPFRRTRGARIL